MKRRVLERVEAAPITLEPVADAMDAFGRATFAGIGVGYVLAVVCVTYERVFQELHEAYGRHP